MISFFFCYFAMIQGDCLRFFVCFFFSQGNLCQLKWVSGSGAMVVCVCVSVLFSFDVMRSYVEERNKIGSVFFAGSNKLIRVEVMFPFLHTQNVC